jgi:pimeloyl-ACP methyl ester carboxylesterase
LIRFRRGEGPRLLLLHGLGLSWRSWKPVLPLLTGRREVIALDLPGFGEAAPLDEPPTVAALAAAVDAELAEARIDRVAIAGNSLGGAVGLELARRGRASSVVVLGPAGMETQAERAGVIALNEAHRALYATVAPAAGALTANPASRAALLGWLHGRPWRVAADDGAAEIRDFARAPHFHATLRHATSTWSASQLSGIDVPVRVCVGSRDLLIGAPNAPRHGAAIPGAQVSWLPGCGHVPMADDPERVADVIAAGSVPPSRPRARARPGSRPGPRT